MRRGVFLSIDADWWEDAERFSRAVEDALAFHLSRGVPVSAVMNHHQMLREVNASTARKLVNIDEHSDLVDGDALRDVHLNCGTWVSYVKWRKVGSYVWVGNRCNPHIGCCSNDWRGPLFKPSGSAARDTGWKSARRSFSVSSMRRWIKHLDVVETSLCMSPGWSSDEIISEFRRIVRDFDIPYRKGRRNEDP